MQRDCHIVYAITRNIYTKTISKVTFFNCFETLAQAKASLQHEYDVEVNENCDPMDESDRPVWLNDAHTELKLAPGYDPSYETLVYIDSGTKFHDANEPKIKYE